ncbi:hypothetical protein [Tessaracoccus flavus]|uniref:hypothetical protein n=1 Tax=Tessaracoccus flavus TaxID=1610493 RepID=UPI00089CCE95|nr:hypothetical protein [Tessaracoccus flavus]SDY51222.1 hypothetical protein SAMN05428934_102106 [Tessaracoccus flavus]
MPIWASVSFIAPLQWGELTTERVVKDPAGLDLTGLLDLVEAQMKTAPEGS